MSFKIIYTSCQLLVTCIQFASGISDTCQDFKGVRPQFTIHRFGPIQFIPTESLESINGTVDFSLQPLDCSHTSPVDLIVDIDPIANPFGIRRTFFSRKLKSDSNSNETNHTSWTYISYFVFLYKTKVFRDPVLFLCQPIDLTEECSRTFLEVTPAKYSSTFIPSVIPSSKQFEDLSKNLLSRFPPSSGNKSDHSGCSIKLLIKMFPGNRLEYKWEGEKLITEKVITTNEISYLNGIFRSVKQEKQCVQLLETTQSCKDCKIVPDPIINSLAFYAKSESTEMVFKGLFNLSSKPHGPRHFYMDWDVPLNEMIHMDAPSVAYVNRSVRIACSVSLFYFAFGTVLTIDDKPGDIPSGETEVYMEDGRREVFKNFTFSDGNTSAKVTCFAPLWNSTKRISKFETIFIDYPELPKINGSGENMLESLVAERDEVNRTLSCSATGKPLPTLEWKVPNENIRHELTFAKHENINFIKLDLTIPILKQEFLGVYKCLASNYLGAVSRAYDIQIPFEGLSQGSKAGLGSALGILVVIFVGAILLIYRKIVLQRQEFRTKTAEAIQEFKEGIKRKDVDDRHKMEQNISILEQRYNDEFEKPFDKWTIENKFLGQGAFGIVRKGTVEIDNKIQVVAIKMLKSSVEIEDFKSFLTELKIMAYIGHHANIVNLVAACSQNIEERDVMIGVEFCPNGNLLEYLQNKGSMFKAFNEHEEVVPVPASMQSTARYANVVVNSVCLTELDLYTWAYQIASGMEFLATKRVLHGDLATRNVLLSSDKTAKISDFGLSRVLLDSSNYTKKSKVPLPWKWMAIESLSSMTFSTASDVWSYGVTVWEIFSLGEAPYAGLHFSRNFVSQLEEGLRLGKPSRATDHTYDVLLLCWSNDPALRLTFTQLKTAFSDILGSFNNLTSPNQLAIPSAIPTAQPRNPNALSMDALYTNVPRSANVYLNS